MHNDDLDTLTTTMVPALTTADISTIGTLDISSFNTMTLDMSSLSHSLNAGSLSYTSPYYSGNLTIGNVSNPSLDVKGDANFEGNIKWKGKSLEDLFSKIEDRLAILQPDPKKLEKYEALRKAYEHYKLMEKLVQED